MNRRAVLIGAGAAVLVLILWYVVLWSPRQGAISDAKDRRDAAELEAGRLRTTLARLEELKQNEALTRSRLEELRVAVPDQPNLAQFILDANEAANRAGIEFLSVTPSPPAVPAASPDTDPAAAPTVSSIGLAMSVTGGYFQVIDYLNRLTDLPRVVVIDNLTVSPDEGGRSLSVTLQARMFTTAAPGALGTATTTTVPPAAAPTTTAAPTTPTTGAP